MSTNESQELAFLKIFATNNITFFYATDIPKSLLDYAGSGATSLIKNMNRDGFISVDPADSNYLEFNEAGRNRYRILKKNKRTENIINWSIFSTLILTAATLYYVVKADWRENVKDRPKPKQQEQLMKQNLQLPILPSKYDSTKAHPLDSVEK
jgi:hypothetical protein